MMRRRTTRWVLVVRRTSSSDCQGKDRGGRGRLSCRGRARGKWTRLLLQMRTSRRSMRVEQVRGWRRSNGERVRSLSTAAGTPSANDGHPSSCIPTTINSTSKTNTSTLTSRGLKVTSQLLRTSTRTPTRATSFDDKLSTGEVSPLYHQAPRLSQAQLPLNSLRPPSTLHAQLTSNRFPLTLSYHPTPTPPSDRPPTACTRPIQSPHPNSSLPSHPPSSQPPRTYPILSTRTLTSGCRSPSYISWARLWTLRSMRG